MLLAEGWETDAYLPALTVPDAAATPAYDAAVQSLTLSLGL